MKKILIMCYAVVLSALHIHAQQTNFPLSKTEYNSRVSKVRSLLDEKKESAARAEFNQLIKDCAAGEIMEERMEYFEKNGNQTAIENYRKLAGKLGEIFSDITMKIPDMYQNREVLETLLVKYGEVIYKL